MDEIEKLKKTRLEGKENKKRKRSKSKNKESRKELKLMIDAKFFEIKLDPNRYFLFPSFLYFTQEN